MIRISNLPSFLAGAIMTPDRQTTLRNLKRLLPASLIAGLAGGGLLVLLTYVHTWCWGGIACYNHGLFDAIGTFQNLVLGILSLLLAGMLPAALSREGGTRRGSAVLAGGIAGFTAFLVLEMYSMVTAAFGHGYAAGLSDVLSLAHDTLANHALPLLAIGLAMAALAALGAFVVSFFRERAAGPSEGAAASRLILCSTVALILVAVVLPPLAAHAMLGAGMVDVNPGTALMTTAVSVERTAPDTLVLTAREVPPASVLDPGAPFSVFMNGVDVSNASACTASGFAATVEPAGGLEAIKGSEATWTGAGVLNNGTPVGVVVMAHGVDGSELVVMNLVV
ncbi:hypothetical protein [Methanoculleus receptaculi]|uniref:Uncharacterized protein n=1 Tax=Methanoculleus receptaculi TaxID=394967 RepID=A0AAX4FV20_9EURY|nr:hypothetical protein [Methanoculleus receptaculi]WOX57740.1 hypothetical protein R6Y96_00330 [Methanoculleus receptaculi]